MLVAIEVLSTLFFPANAAPRAEINSKRQHTSFYGNICCPEAKGRLKDEDRLITSLENLGVIAKKLTLLWSEKVHSPKFTWGMELLAQRP